MTIERNIYLRNDGRYEARYVSGKDSKGHTRYKAVYANTLEAVKERLCEALRRTEETPQINDITIVAALREHLLTESIRLKPSTVGVYSNYLNNYIAVYFKDMTVSELTNEKLQDFIKTQIDNGLSATVVQSVFNFLKTGVTGQSGIWNVVLPKIIKHKADFFTVTEQKQLEEAARDYGGGTYVAIMLCLYTGLRIGEVCGLRYEDINFEKKTITIKRTIQRIKRKDSLNVTEIVALAPKSQSSNRAIPLPDFTAQILTAKGGEGYVISDSEKPLEPRTLQYRFKRLTYAAGIRSVNFHTTRHTFAARAIENGFDVKTLSEIMGHSSAAITLTKYAHISDECKRRHMNALSGVFDQNGDHM
jgi:integrase